MNQYDIGDTVVLSAAFTDNNDLPADPATITLRIRKPDLQLVTSAFGAGSMVKDSTGNYHYDYVPDQSGNYYYRYIGTGSIPTQEETGFYVRIQRA